MISGEGVRGLEWSKWSAETEPQHNIKCSQHSALTTKILFDTLLES